MSSLRVLYAGNQIRLGEVVDLFARRRTPLVLKRARNGDDLLQRLAADPNFDAILIDRDLPPENGLRAIESVVASGYPAPLLMLSDRGDRPTAEAALAAGATDFVVCRPSYVDALPRIFREALQTYRLRETAQLTARHQAELDVLLVLQRRLCGGEEPWEAYPLLADLFRSACAYDRLVVWQVEPDGFGQASFVAGKRLGLHQGDRRPLIGTLAGRALDQRRAVLAAPGDQETRTRGFRSAVAAPLIENGQPTGALELLSTSTRYDDETVRFLAATAEQISAALGLAARQRREEEDQRQQARQEAVRQMGLTVSHELNQPLTILMGYLELLRTQRPEPGVAAQYWDRMDEAGRDLARRLQQIATVTGESVITYGDDMTVFELGDFPENGSGEKGT
jgi:signal transduction histidine kinase